MKNFQNFVLDYNVAAPQAVWETGADLLIANGGGRAGTSPTLSDADVQLLAATGLSIVGYVDSSVTLEAANYWNPDWTDGGDDTDPVKDSAPNWLRNGILIDVDGDGKFDARRIDYRDLDWQKIVVDQARDLMARGYSGVFLDDVDSFLYLSSKSSDQEGLAKDMVELVKSVRQAIGVDATLVTNGNPLIGPWATKAGGDEKGFLSAIDAMLLESYARAPDDFALNLALEHVAPSVQLLALEFAGKYENYVGEEVDLNPTTLFEVLRKNDGYGILSFFANSPAYGDLGIDRGLADDSPNVLFGTGGRDLIDGRDGDDRLAGFSGEDLLLGRGGNDTILGGSGLDVLDGGTGADTMEGGDDNDTYFVDNAGDVIVELVGGGTADWVKASVTFDLVAGVEVEILSTTNAKGTAKINLYGNEFAQKITGNAAANILSDGGKGGSDTLVGLGGNDIYKVYNSGTKIVEAAGGGSDTVQAAVDYTVGKGVYIQILETTNAAGKSALALYSNEFGQTVNGNAGDNSLRGYGGNDTINGGAGDDRISGGAGNDTLTGNAGADRYYFSSALDEAANVDKISGISSIDSIYLSKAIFTELGAVGKLAASAFVRNATGEAQDASDRIIFEWDTGILRYDPDGTGAAAALKFADVGSVTLEQMFVY